MKRDPRLHGLSHHHHYALVLSRHLRLAAHDGLDAVRREWEAFDLASLMSHFATEEELLLPALEWAGLGELAGRMREEHRRLRAQIAALEEDEVTAFESLAVALHEHVRWEERVLFPACEAHLDDAVLDEVARRAPPEEQGGGAMQEVFDD